MEKYKISFSLLISVLLLINCSGSENNDVTQLKLIQALPVEGPPNNQPSGLTIRNDTLFTVSDKHDHTIFQIKLEKDRAVLIPYITFEVPEPGFEHKLDFEGITCDSEGHFYLVSETAFRILKVSAKGKNVTWITPELRPYGEEKGLFKHKNAFLEGITWIEPYKFILCAEREPRGILEVDFNSTSYQVKAYKMDFTKFDSKKGISPDFSDLFYEDHDLYALERNSFVICQLLFNGQGYEEGIGWSYEKTETDKKYRYTDTRFGKAEGFCMNDQFIFIILDNNNDPRLSDPQDRRSLLFIFERPFE